MTVDPSKIEPKGKPTRAEARAVWDSMPDASARKVASSLTNLGYEISWRTIARWHAADWVEVEIVRSPAAEIASSSVVQKLGAAVRAEMKKLEAPKVQNPAPEQTGLEAAVAPPIPTVDEIALIEARRAELMLESEAELDKIAAKARIVLNILMMESAARRSHVMVLIPKETSALVDSFTEASRVGLSGKDGQPPSAGDPRTIEGTVNRDVLPEEPPNEVADAIRKFRRAREAA